MPNFINLPAFTEDGDVHVVPVVKATIPSVTHLYDGRSP